MAFGPFSSESNATETNVLATDQAQAASQSTIVNPYGKGAGKKGKFIESGGIDLAGSKNVNFGTQILTALKNLKGFKGDINFTSTTVAPVVPEPGAPQPGASQPEPPASNEQPFNAPADQTATPSKWEAVKNFFLSTEGKLTTAAWTVIGLVIGGVLFWRWVKR